MRAALRSKQMKVNSSSNLVFFFFPCHLIIFIPSAAGCFIWHVCCVSACRTWRRQRSTSDTPRDWTPWSQLPSQAFPLTSPRLETYSPGQTTQFTWRRGEQICVCWTRCLHLRSLVETMCDRGWGEIITPLCATTSHPRCVTSRLYLLSSPLIPYNYKNALNVLLDC